MWQISRTVASFGTPLMCNVGDALSGSRGGGGPPRGGPIGPPRIGGGGPGTAAAAPSSPARRGRGPSSPIPAARPVRPGDPGRTRRPGRVPWEGAGRPSAWEGAGRRASGRRRSCRGIPNCRRRRRHPAEACFPALARADRPGTRIRRRRIRRRFASVCRRGLRQPAPDWRRAPVGLVDHHFEPVARGVVVVVARGHRGGFVREAEVTDGPVDRKGGARGRDVQATRARAVKGSELGERVTFGGAEPCSG